MSQDSTRLASRGDDQTVTIGDLPTGRELQTLKPNAGVVFGVEFSPDGGRLAAASLPFPVTVWDARPLTADVRAELVAADLLDKFLPRVKIDGALPRLIRDRSSIDKAVRRRALEWRASAGKRRAQPSPRSKQVLNQRSSRTTSVR
jgi:WD40 repeat protein